jgi:hypothetical protein
VQAVGVGNHQLARRDLAHELGATVAAVNYRLAPEFPFPTPLEDCYAGLIWLAGLPAVDRESRTPSACAPSTSRSTSSRPAMGSSGTSPTVEAASSSSASVPDLTSCLSSGTLSSASP